MTHPFNPHDPYGPMRLIMREVLEDCLGIVPRGQTAQYAAPVDAGVSNSGTFPEVTELHTATSRANVMQVTSPLTVQNGCNGLASIHVSVSDVTLVGGEREIEPNGKLMLDVEWRSGRGSGKAKVDITHGAFFAVGGVQVNNLYAYWERNNAETQLRLLTTKRVEANVHWRTSINPVKARITFPSVTLAADTASAWVRLPDHAADFYAWGDTPTSFPQLIAEFATRDDAGAIVARTLNPFANGSPAGLHGIEFFRFISAEPQSVFGIFELNI